MSFGGPWTEQKLACVQKYMQAYATAMKRQPFRLDYVDAFAGSGDLQPPARTTDASEALFAAEARDSTEFRAGSARLALQIEPPLDRYLFIEKRAGNVRQLEALCESHPDRAERCQVIRGDANQVLAEYCEQDWSVRRALVFLDPFGTEVQWSTLQALGATHAVDLWYLFPLSGVLRMATTDGAIPADWAARLDSVLGTDEWRTEFYRPSSQLALFGDDPAALERTVDTESLRQFVMGRVQTAFHAVSPDSRILCNSKNSPLFLLVFAAANRRGAPLALRIADHILKKV